MLIIYIPPIIFLSSYFFKINKYKVRFNLSFNIKIRKITFIP